MECGSSAGFEVTASKSLCMKTGVDKQQVSTTCVFHAFVQSRKYFFAQQAHRSTLLRAANQGSTLLFSLPFPKLNPVTASGFFRSQHTAQVAILEDSVSHGSRKYLRHAREE